MRTKKRRWVGMRIACVELSPEQAVLSCCDSTKHSVAFTPGGQCDNSPGNCSPAGAGGQYTSS